MFSLTITQINLMILAIIQARMSSSRLPGKVLKHIFEKPMLYYQLERIKKTASIDKLLVATSIDPSDDPIEDVCRSCDTVCYRGSLDDVLDRFYQASKLYTPKHVVRFTADCPLTDHEINDAVIDLHIQGDFDYTSNCLPPTFPDGLSIEIMRWQILQEAWQMANLPSQREHVTLYIYKNPKYKLGNFRNNIDLSSLRWTVDHDEDFEFVKKIYESLYPNKLDFSMADILRYLETNPNLQSINSKYKRYEGLKKSLEKDRNYLSRYNNEIKKQ